MCEAFERVTALAPEPAARVELLVRLWACAGSRAEAAPASDGALMVTHELIQLARSLLPEHGREGAVFLRIAHALPDVAAAGTSPVIPFVEGMLRTEAGMEDLVFLKLATSLWLGDAKRRSLFGTWSLVAHEVQCIFDLIDPAAGVEGGGEPDPVSLEPSLKVSTLKR